MKVDFVELLPKSILMQGPGKLLLILAISLVGTTAHAVLGSKLSISRLSQVEKTEVYVFRDHRSKVRYKGSILVQNKEGELPKMRLFSFDQSEMRLNGLRAWTSIGNQRFDVPQNLIQITPTHEEAGFSNNVNVEVAFPKMTVGSTVHWEYEVEELNPPLHGFFSYVYRLENDYHSAGGFHFHIDSEVPLYSAEHDPSSVLVVKRKKHTYDVLLNKDVSNYIINESYSFLSLNRFPTMIISTAPKWDGVGSGLLRAYNARLTEPKTALVDSLVRKVRAKKGAAAQFRELNFQLGKSLRYMGDWRSRFSGQIPRPLKAISDSQFGDCKDFSLVAVRVLRELGYKAHLATVYSDRVAIPDRYYKFPVNYFNHQIVYVHADKKDYWLDPTSPEDTTFVDDNLSNRMAIVWENNKPVPRKIPAHKDSDNGFNYKLVMTPRADQGYTGDLTIDTWGLETKFAKGEDGPSNQMLRWVNHFFPDVKAVRQDVRTVKASSNKPWAHQQKGAGIFANMLDRTPMGEGFRLNSSGLMKVLMEANSSWVSDFDFGFPSTREYKLEFRNRSFIVSGDDACSVSSPWLNVSLKVGNEGNNGVLTYKETFKTIEIPNKDLRSTQFRAIQDRIRSCLIGRFFLVRNPKTVIAKKASPPPPVARTRAKKVEPVRTVQRTVASTPRQTIVIPSSTPASGNGMTIALKRVKPPVGQAKFHSRTMKSVTMPARKTAGVGSNAEKLEKAIFENSQGATAQAPRTKVDDLFDEGEVPKK